jgi:hypothetical protein
MPAPITVSAAGYFVATRAGAPVGEATLRMKTATKGKLSLGGQELSITGDAAKKTFRGTKSGSVVQLKIVNRNRLTGTVDGDAFELARAVLRPIPASEMA